MMISFKKFTAIAAAAVTVFTSCAVSMADLPNVKVYADTPVQTAFCDGDELYGYQKFKGNYITVVQYTNSSATKEKAVYSFETKDGIFRFDLSNFNLKKETYFKVYDETMDPANVALITVPAQSDKVTIKINSTTSDKLYGSDGLFSIKVGKNEVTDNETAKDIYIKGFYYYGIYLNELNFDSTTGTSISTGSNAERIMSMVKEMASKGGGTLDVYYKKTGTINNRRVSYPKSTAVKLKIPAAPKAPKVTIDYVNNVYKLPTKSEYAVLGVDSNGAVEHFKLGSEKITATTVTNDNKNLDIDTIFKEGVEQKRISENATSAAICVVIPASSKKFASVPAIIKVNRLEQPKYVAKNVVSGSEVKGTTIFGAEVRLGKDVIASFAKSDSSRPKPDDVKITALVDISYKIASSTKWTTLKKGTSKIVSIPAGSQVEIKKLGVKETKSSKGSFGSAAVVFQCTKTE